MGEGDEIARRVAGDDRVIGGAPAGVDVQPVAVDPAVRGDIPFMDRRAHSACPQRLGQAEAANAATHD